MIRNRRGGAVVALPTMPRKGFGQPFSAGLPWERICFGAFLLCTLVASANLATLILEHRDKGWLSVVVAAVLMLCALVSSIAGFAFAALAGSALAYLGIDRVHAVQMMVVCSIATQLYAVWKIHASIRWVSLWPMILAGSITIPLGVWLLVHVDGPVYAAGLGTFVACYAFYVLLRRGASIVRGNAWHDAIAGALGGVAGGLAGFPGSFVTIWCSMRGWDKLQQRAVYQPYILAMQIVAIVCLRWQAPADSDIAQALVFVPFALWGAIAGLAVFQCLTNRQFQVALSVLLAISGVGLLSRAF
jgi:uncharacterized membrane protein YfcA